jgi:predicted nuclease with TOPRIM domain
MQKLLRAAAAINHASTAAALQHTLSKQDFRVAAVFAKIWMQASDNLAAADSQPDVNRKMASLQRLANKMAVAYDKQQDATQQEPSGRSVKLGTDQGAASGVGCDQGLDPVADTEEQQQQPQQQLHHELATSRRDLQDVLQELHGLKVELSEKQAAKIRLQDSFDRKHAAYRTLQDKIKTQQAALSTLQDNMHAQQTAYDVFRDKLAVETKAFEQLKGTKVLQDTPNKGNKQWQATQLIQLKELQEQVRAEKRTLRQQQAQCRQQQAELDAGLAQLASGRANLQADQDAWLAQQAERVATQARMQKQAAECKARFEEQQAEYKVRLQERKADLEARLQEKEAECKARMKQQEAECKALVPQHQAALSRFEKRHAAIKRTISSTDGCKLQKIAAEQIRLEEESAELAAGRA